MDVPQLAGKIDVEGVKEKFETCKHFQVDSEMENGGHRFFIFAMEKLDAHILSLKLDTVFGNLKCAAKLNVAFGFVHKIVEDGFCRYYYAHENNTLMD